MPCLPARAIVAALLAACLQACGDGPVSPPPPSPPPAVQVRAVSDYFEVNRGAGWQQFIVNGVNLGVAMPGFYPGEFPATRADYDRWLAGMAEMNANTVRLYALHNPVFYQALRDWNLGHPQRPVYLLQGIWLDERTTGDYITDSPQDFEAELRFAVDAAHGKAEVPVRPGKASGRFDADVSPWLLAWLAGSEMDPRLVLESNTVWASQDRYAGRYLAMKPGGLPIEAWVAHELDLLIGYELERYGAQRPVAWTSSAALDPLHHPTEPANDAQDWVDCDFAKFSPLPPFDRGVFAAYAAFPFDPEFISYDPHYAAWRDESGRASSYRGYLEALKGAHRGRAVLVSDFGVPSSRGLAHVAPNTFNLGGYSEMEQADATWQMAHDILDAGMAGSVAYGWLDEWFKRSWTTAATTLPSDRGRLAWDVQNPAEQFGILSYYPLPGWSKQLDGAAKDWLASDFRVANPATAPPLDPTAPAADTLQSLQLAADPAFLYVKLQFAAEAPPDLGRLHLLIAISTLEGETGNHRLAALHAGDGTAISATGGGFEALVQLDPAAPTPELRIDAAYDPMPALNGETAAGGTPLPTDDGRFVLEQQLVNDDAPYLVAPLQIDGKTWPPPARAYAPWGKLRVGDAGADSLATVQPGPGGVLELRLPWHALWVTDPSSRSVLWNDPATPGWEAQVSGGVRVFVATAQPSGATWRLVDALPRGAVVGGSLAVSALPLYAWPTWDSLDHVAERRKPVFQALQAVFAEHP